jgi:hypothetical protein
LLALPYNAYMRRLREHFLPAGWEGDYMYNVLEQQENSNFSSWVSRVKSANSCLHDTTYHKDEAFMLRHLHEGMNAPFRRRYREFCLTENLDNIANMEEWIQRVTSLAKGFEADHAMRGFSGSTSNPPSLLECITPHHQPSSSASWVSPNQSSSRPHASSFTPQSSVSRNYPSLMELYDQLPSWVPRPPALTDEWRKYLIWNKGCYRCCGIYVDHLAPDCDMIRNIKAQNWAHMLPPEECCPLFEAWRDRPRQGCQAAPVFPSNAVTDSVGDLNAEFIAACQDKNSVFLDGSTTVNAVDFGPSACSVTIEEYPAPDNYPSSTDNYYATNSVWSNDEPNVSFVGTVFPEKSSEDSDEDMYLNDPDAVQLDEEYMLSPSTPPPRDHLLWPCHIDGPASLPVLHALIDHGCPTVLISCRVVNGLALHRFALKSRLSLGGVGGGTFSCTEFVKL